MRPIWLWRLFLAGFAVAYLLSATLQEWLPPLLPFLAAVAVEAQFFFAGAAAVGEAQAAEDVFDEPAEHAAVALRSDQ